MRRVSYQQPKMVKHAFFLNKKSMLLLLTFMLLGFHVFLAVQTSSMGARIALYEEEIDKLENTNEELSLSLMNSTSLTKINEFSQRMSFKKIDKTLYLHAGESFAKAQ